MIVILPILIPLITAAISMICWRRQLAQRILSLTGVSISLIVSIILMSQVFSNGIQVLQVGNWPAPYGITLVADRLSAIMVFITAVSGLCIAIYSLASIDVRREAFGYHPIYNVLLMGVSGSFLTGDLFNLFVWFEVILMSSFVLLSLGGERAQLEGSIKYVTINMFASVLFLVAVALLYGLVGTLNMADLAMKVRNGVSVGHSVTLSMLFLVAFGIKAAVFPLFSWLPASYHTPPIAITSIFAAILSKVGVYALIRIFTLIFVQDVTYTHTILIVIAAFTMATGILGALCQNDIRRILAFYSISQVGFMVMGLGLYTPMGIAATIVFFVHHCFVKTSMFLTAGIINHYKGTFDIKKLGGLLNSYPLLGFLFFLTALASFGIPPLSGFFAKYLLFYEGLKTKHYLITAVAILASLFSLLPIARMWTEAFWKREPFKSEESEEIRVYSFGDKFALYSPIIVLTSLAILMGIFASPIYDTVKAAAYQVYDPTDYIQAVLKGGVR